MEAIEKSGDSCCELLSIIITFEVGNNWESTTNVVNCFQLLLPLKLETTIYSKENG
jgi:hypothetical protein